jgi:YVTN family beta-propeller protein
MVAVDLDAEEVIEDVDVPGHPHNVTVAPDGTAVGALQRAGTIALVRDGDASTVELGASPHDVKPVGDDVIVVANELGERIEIVSTDGELLQTVPLRAQPHDVAVTPDERHAWASLNRTDELAVVDLDDQDVRYVPTGRRPHDLLFAPDGRLWVTDWDGPLHVLSPDGEVIESISLGREAHHLTFTPDGSEVWVTDHAEHAVFVVSTETFEVVERLDIPGSPHHVAITRDGELAAVADHTSETLVVFDVSEREEVATIEVGAGPHGVWTAPGP